MPFLLEEERKLEGFTGVIVDDTISAKNDDFVELEVSVSSRFDVKPKETAFPLKFAALLIDEVDIHDTPSLQHDQIPYAQEIKLLDSATILIQISRKLSRTLVGNSCMQGH